jgi:MinD-like ATPase involved in chromosome partitioning or flagellar assembly
MSIPVVTFGPDQQFVVGGLERLHGPVTVVRRCTELTELLAACESGLARAAVISADASELSASLMERLDAVGVSVVVLTDSTIEIARLESIGVVPARSDIAPSDLADQIIFAVDRQHGRSSGPRTVTSMAFAESAPQRAGEMPAAEPEGEGTGRVIAVWGPVGAPGRTTVAINVAAELAARGKSVILADADSYGASASGMLGLLDESAGLAQACLLADQGVLDAGGLTRIAGEVHIRGGSFRLLGGITRADRWTELRPSALSTVLERAKQVAELVVVDVGFCLEADEEISFDSMAPRRNGAALRILELADEVLAVGAADAIGVPRLVKGLEQLRGATGQTTPRVVLNKVRQSAVGRGPKQQLQLAWERFGPGVGISSYLPWDADSCDASLLKGSVLLESAPESALRKSLRELSCALIQQKCDSVGRNTRALGFLKR